MERRDRSFQMLNYIVPIILFCIPSDGACDGHTKFYEEVLDPVTLPSQCLMDASVHAAQYMAKWKEEHPHKDLDYRIICKRSDQKT